MILFALFGGVIGGWRVFWGVRRWNGRVGKIGKVIFDKIFIICYTRYKLVEGKEDLANASIKV